jgi:hypothetical protein
MKSHDQISATYLISRTGLHVNTASPPPWRLPSNREDDPGYIPAYTRGKQKPQKRQAHTHAHALRAHVILPLAYRAPMSAIGRSVSIYLISLENPAPSSAHRGSTTPAPRAPITSLPPLLSTSKSSCMSLSPTHCHPTLSLSLRPVPPRLHC